MADGSGLVYKYDKARASLKPELSASIHQAAVEKGGDVPEQIPRFRIAISEVGISDKTFWISLPQGRLPFQGSVFIDLSANSRGIHMSRIEKAIALLYPRRFEDIRFFALDLAGMLLATQSAQRASVRIRGRIPLLRKTPVSRQTSVDSADISTEVQIVRQENGTTPVESLIGVSLSHITACPCTQVYNQVLTEIEEACLSASQSEIEGENRTIPMPTHSQRSITGLSVSDLDGTISFDVLFQCLDAALHLTQDLLKRPDEAEMVLKAHRAPQFAEDAVRETARAAGIILGDRLPGDAGVVIESLSLESIHCHNVSCRLETTMETITGALQSQEDLNGKF
ncbi:MAG TPA: hypothetical protein EYP57_00845 [Thermodesulfobacteriaceae bacterium]|nr:hypothetical protein [Thermodesulfobacteriaceae bacterium]